jgi:hypothetical protein
MVIAAGSVIREPSNGTTARANQAIDTELRKGSRSEME